MWLQWLWGITGSFYPSQRLNYSGGDDNDKQTQKEGGGRNMHEMKWKRSVCERFFVFFVFLPQMSAVKYFGRIDPPTHTVCVTVAVLIFPRGHQ